jgi:hypothetical protein
VDAKVVRRRVAAFALIAGLALPSAASAWTTHVTVGPQTVKWVSSQRFAKDDLLRLRLFVKGHELRADDTSDCRSTLYGSGLVVEANTCGRHLVLDAASARGDSVRLRIHYYRI